MSSLSCITRASSSPQGKPRVWFCCHPDDQARLLEPLAKELLEAADCAVWYDPDPAARLSEEEQAEREAALADMQLFVMPVTTRLLTAPSPALSWQFPLAQRLHIPVLPILQEPGLEALFNEKCGDLQCLDPNQTDPTALPYAEKLKKFLAGALVGDELAAKVRAAFDAYIFLSYRKKDRRQAQALMRLIHQNHFCRDIAIWYDEFLTPGEDFNAAIIRALEKSGLFVLAVTPHLLETGNYVMTQEFPAARGAGKPILPVEMDPTDRAGLEAAYPGIPPCAEAATLPAGLQAALRGLALRENDADPAHTYFIGLAYLAGIDVEVDKKRGSNLICDAARRGLPEAMEKLVAMYRTGDGMARDYTAAARWQRILADERRAEWEGRPDEGHFLAYADALWELGDQYKDLGELAAARRLWEKEFLPLAAQGEEQGLAPAPRYRATGCGKLGEVCRELGELPEARRLLKESWTRRRALAEATNTHRARREQAEAGLRLGDLCCDEGREDDAGLWFGQAIALARALAKETGTVRDRAVLALACERLGGLYASGRGMPDPRPLLEEALDLRRALAEETGTDTARRELVVSCLTLGSLYRSRRQPKEARRLFEESVTLRRDLAQKNGAPWTRRALAVGCSRMATLCRDENDTPAARRWLEEAKALHQALAEETNIPADRDSLAVALYKLGTLPGGDPDALCQAHALWARLAEECPAVPRYAKNRDIARSLAAKQSCVL